MSELDIDVARDIARRATDVERERCLSVIEAEYVNADIDGQTNERTSDVCSAVCTAMLNVGAVIAGGDTGPHSDAALAWRRRVTGEVTP